MRSSLLLAWRYIGFHRRSTAILVVAIALTVFLPLATRWGILQFEKHATNRAAATPLLIGAKGSRYGLAIQSLYFRGESPESIHFSEVERVRSTGLAQAIPLHVRFRTRGAMIVGTSKEYFGFRGLKLAEGQPLKRIGDCVVGAAVAQRLTIKPGDQMLSESENLFDLSGPAPLSMRVAGILHHSGTADDESVLCDVETTWIIEGIGHGHVVKPGGEDGQHAHEAQRQYLQQHQEVTVENIDSFHFHGKRSQFPITAIIAVPDSDRSETLLIGKYLSPQESHQIIRPIEVVDELMQVISQVRRIFNIAVVFLSAATGMLVILVLILSVRLRKREIRTMYLLGCSRGKVVQVVATEMAIVLTVGVSIAFLGALLASPVLEWAFFNLL